SAVFISFTRSALVAGLSLYLLRSYYNDKNSYLKVVTWLIFVFIWRFKFSSEHL
ncbi:hypothetical protein HN51_012323, partial [Arachis hypogaea]